MKDVQRDLDDARQARDDLTAQVRDNEKKLKALEAEFMQMQEVLALFSAGMFLKLLDVPQNSIIIFYLKLHFDI